MTADVASLRPRALSGPAVEAEAAAPSPQAAGRADRLALGLACLALIGAAGWAAWRAEARIDALEAALKARPPLAVVDYAAVSKAIAAGAGPEAVEPVFVSIKERAARLGEAGFLVVNRASVESAPPGLVFGPEREAERRLAATLAVAGELGAPRPAPVASQAMTDEEAAALLRGFVEAGR